MGKYCGLYKIRWFCNYDWIIFGYITLSIILSWYFDFIIYYNIVFHFKYDLPLLGLITLSLLLVMLCTTLKKSLTREDASLFGPSWRAHMCQYYFTVQRAYDLIRILILLKLVLTIYCNIKQAIPSINPFTYDDILLRSDILFHFGVNPMELCIAALGSPAVSGFFDWLYVTWYGVKILILIIFILLQDRNLNIQFFRAYFALWILGGLTAVLIPSLGPIYCYSDWFANLNKPIATTLQHQLWSHYQQVLISPDQYKVFIYEGIAAFPSLHVGVVALFTFFLFHVHRILGILMAIYTLLIQIGSVLLGWHYAIDGYFAILLAFVLYKFSIREYKVMCSISCSDSES